MLEQLSQYITEKLKEHDIIVIRNDSRGSIYLTFDCGQSGFLRISDHAPKRDLHARYNLITTQRKRQRVVVPTTDVTYNIIKYFYTLNDVDLLIYDIINYVEIRKQFIGEQKYSQFCKCAIKTKLHTNEGFWYNCKMM